MSVCTALEAIQLNTTPQTFIFVLRLTVSLKMQGPKKSSLLEGEITHHLSAHSRFGPSTVHTGVNDISGNPWSLHHLCFRPHPEECTSNTIVVSFMGLSCEKGTDPRIVGEQGHTGLSLGNGLDSTTASQES